MEAKYPILNLGTPLCEKLKMIYFTDTHWSNCYKEVAQKFTLLKENMRKFYTDKTDIEILQELNKYSSEDIRDALEGST